jgi:hypothetical protein
MKLSGRKIQRGDAEMARWGDVEMVTTLLYFVSTNPSSSYSV